MNIPIWEKAAMTVEEASEYSNIGIVNKKLVKKKEFLEFLSKVNRI